MGVPKQAKERPVGRGIPGSAMARSLGHARCVAGEDLANIEASAKAKLLDAYDLQRFLSDYRDLQSWISSMMALVSSDELAKDVTGAEALLERHQVSHGGSRSLGRSVCYKPPRLFRAIVARPCSFKTNSYCLRRFKSRLYHPLLSSLRQAESYDLTNLRWKRL